MNVLITGSRAPVAIDLAKHLALAGHKVWMADSLRYPIGRFSRYIQGHLFLPRPVESLRAFRQAIQNAVNQFGIDRVIPTCEEVFYYDDRWSSDGLAFRSPLSLLRSIHHKFEFAIRVQGLKCADVSSPPTHLISDSSELHSFVKDSVEWVFKPVYSRFASRTLIGPDAHELLASAHPTATYPWVAQRRIHGPEYSTYCIAHAGTMTAWACYHSLYKAGKGSGIYFVQHRDSRIEAFLKTLCQSLNLTGQLGLDLIEDAEGKIWVLEGNPRATSGVHLFSAADGLSDALLNNQGSGDQPVLIQPCSARPIALGFAMPFWGVKSAYQNGRLAVFISDWWQARDAVFSWRDLGPTIGILPALAELMSISLRENRSLAEASTFDIEWNGEPLCDAELLA